MRSVRRRAFVYGTDDAGSQSLRMKTALFRLETAPLAGTLRLGTPGALHPAEVR